MPRPTALDAAIERIETEVHRHGSCLVSEEELFLICGDALDNSERFAAIRNLAMRNQWAFQLDGRASSVVFKQLPAEREDDIIVNGLAIEQVSD